MITYYIIVTSGLIGAFVFSWYCYKDSPCRIEDKALGVVLFSIASVVVLFSSYMVAVESILPNSINTVVKEFPQAQVASYTPEGKTIGDCKIFFIDNDEFQVLDGDVEAANIRGVKKVVKKEGRLKWFWWEQVAHKYEVIYNPWPVHPRKVS